MRTWRDEQAARRIVTVGADGERRGHGWSTFAEVLAVVLHGRNLRTSLAVALLVGTILFLINQADVVLSGHATATTWLKVALTYFVPFLVCNYGILVATRKPGRHG